MYRDFAGKFNDFIYAFLKHFMKDEVEAFETIFGGNFELSWPTFPLNTDGVDVAGSNVTIKNINITNFDDAIAIKSSH